VCPTTSTPETGNTCVLGADCLGIGLGKIVDTGSEGVKVFAERGILRRVPFPGPFGNAIELHPPVQFKIRGPPILGGPPARFAIQPEQETGLIPHLGPAMGVKHFLPAGGEDMRNSVMIPEDLGLAVAERQRRKQKS
jgi:hypothetical protein